MNIYRYYSYSDKISCAGLPSKEDLYMLKQEGIEIVISLSMPTDSRTLNNEDKILATLGIPYFHIPVDADTPSLKDFEIFIQLLEHFKAYKLLIHCTKNHRVSIFMYLYHFVEYGELREDILYQFCEPRKEWKMFIELILEKYNKENRWNTK